MSEEDEEEQQMRESMERDERLLMALTGSRALAKSCEDPFDYAMRLRSGEVIRFIDAEVIGPEWIHITPTPQEQQPQDNCALPFPAPRGIDIRMADIIWVMDAPLGS